MRWALPGALLGVCTVTALGQCPSGRELWGDPHSPSEASGSHQQELGCPLRLGSLRPGAVPWQSLSPLGATSEQPRAARRTRMDSSASSTRGE